MTTTFSQFIGPNENLSVSFLSTPDFKNNAQTEIKHEQQIMVENFIHDYDKSPNLQQNKQVKPWSQVYQVKDSKLSFTIDEGKHDQKGQSNYRTFWQTKSQRPNSQNDYTPQSLLEKLRNFKQNKENHQVNSSQDKPFSSFTSESNFSLVSLRNPVYRRLQQMKRQRLQRLKRSGLGWYDKTLYEDIPSGQLYKIPDEDDVVVADNIEDTSESNENENNNHFSSLYNKNKEQNSMSYSSLSIINRLLSQPSVIENSQVRTKTIQQMVKLLKKSYDNQKKIDVQIQTESLLNQLKEPLVVQDINKLTFDQLSGQIIKHLKAIEAINNSLYSESSDGDGKFSIKEEKVMIDSEKDQVVQSKNLQKNKAFTNESQVNSQIKDNRQQKCNLGESKYLRSSHSNFEMTPSQKQRLLQRFNKQQKQMVNQLFQSMISISSQSLQNSMIHNPEKKPIIKTQARIFKSQLCCSPTNSFLMQKVSNKNEVKQSEINFQPPKDQQIRQMTFLKKNYQDIVSLDPSKIMNTSSQEKPQKQLNDGQFEKLEQLMRDRQMKKSILDGSNVADSSFNSQSILQIIDTQTADKFKKFNPDRLKKVEHEQIINQ